MSKILYLNPEETGIWNDHFHQVLSRAARPETELVVKHLPLGEDSAGRISIARMGSTYPPYIPLSQGEMYRALMEAEQEGFDAAIIGCSADPGLDMAKRTVSIPVTAPLEAGLHVHITHPGNAPLHPVGIGQVLVQDMSGVKSGGDEYGHPLPQ